MRLAIAASALLLAAPASPWPHWDDSNANDLLQLVARSRDEGLEPRAYNQHVLQSAVRSHIPDFIDAVATGTALRLLADYRAGAIRDGVRQAWHMPLPDVSDAALRPALERALQDHRLPELTEAMLPTQPDYRALRDALARIPDPGSEQAARIRVNMERWRWMPRDLGPSYVLVNPPAFQLKFVDASGSTARDVIVGAPASPTPQFSTTATGVTLNPWWDIPDTIADESITELMRRDPRRAASMGFVKGPATPGGPRFRQRPGPANALGPVRIEMPNPFNVYLHGTSEPGLFARRDRALSHGCIRVREVLDFAADLLRGRVTRSEVRAAVDSGATSTRRLARPLPVYVGYFTVALAPGGVEAYPDIYRRDGAVARALHETGLTRVQPNTGPVERCGA